MPIEISTQIIHNSYAAVINKIDPNANIYDNPNQQGTAYPAWFIVHRSPVEVMRDFGKRYGGNCYTLTYQIDIWYMIQQNIPRLYDQYTAVAEQLDEQLEYLPIFGSDAVVHVYDKSWSLELNSMKYSTTLRLRVCRSNPDYFNEKTIDVITTEMFLKSKFPLLRIYFTNTEHETLDVNMPSQMFCYYGDTFVLPTVEGVYRDEDNLRWSPVGWNIGSFGETIGPLHENVTADLVMEQVIGYDAPMGGTVGIGVNIGKDEIMRQTPLSQTKEPNYIHTRTLSSFDTIEAGTVTLPSPPQFLEGVIGESLVIPSGKTIERVESQYLYFSKGGGNNYNYTFLKYEESGTNWDTYWKYLPSYDLVQTIPYTGTWYVYSFTYSRWYEIDASTLSLTFDYFGGADIYVGVRRPSTMVVYKNGEWWEMGEGAYEITGNTISFPMITEDNPAFGKPFRVYLT